MAKDDKQQKKPPQLWVRSQGTTQFVGKWKKEQNETHNKPAQ